MSDIRLTQDRVLQQTLAASRIAKSEISRFSGWYGVWCIITTEGSLFAYLFFSYCYALAQSPQRWPLSGPPALLLPILTTLLLLASSGALVFSQSQIWRQGRTQETSNSLGASVIFAIMALALQFYDFQSKALLLSKSAYDSYYALVTGLDILHAAAGVIALLALSLWFFRGAIVGIRRSYVAIIAAYWHFTVFIWLCVFAAFILQPHIG